MDIIATRRATLQMALDAFENIEDARAALRRYTAEGRSGIDGAVQYLLNAATQSTLVEPCEEVAADAVEAFKARLLDAITSL